jgi:hypothetical protein
VCRRAEERSWLKIKNNYMFLMLILIFKSLKIGYFWTTKIPIQKHCGFERLFSSDKSNWHVFSVICFVGRPPATKRYLYFLPWFLKLDPRGVWAFRTDDYALVITLVSGVHYRVFCLEKWNLGLLLLNFSNFRFFYIWPSELPQI